MFVSTDLGSRGLDIPDIDNIIHYHIPETEDNYIHRVGRTARWDKQGRAFFLLSPGEHLPEYVDSEVRIYEIPDTTGMKPSEAKMATVYIGKGKKDKISKGDIVGFICKNANLQGKEIGKIDVKDRYSYVAVPRKKLRLVINSCKGVKIKGIRTVVEEVR